MNLREIHARAKAAAAVARLPLRSGQWSGTAGNVLGRGTGSSIDFQDHRQYVPGDDPRHINWQAYARTGHYSMKLYREEVTPRIDLVYDVSRSMFLDTAKATRVWELFYFCLESGLRIGGHLKLFVLGRATGDIPEELPVEREPDWNGNVEFEDAERGGRSRQRVDAEMLERYRGAYRRHFAAWREECARRGLGFARVGDAGDLLAALRGEAVPAGAIEM